MKKIHGFSWTGLNYEMAEEMVDKINELIEENKKLLERIGLMEDEYKEHLYGTGYKEQGLKE